MGAPNVPTGPSEAQISRDAEFERQRVKYEDEKRRFLEKVSSYDILASDTLRSQQSSFEYSPTINVPDASGLFIPSKFSPSLTYTQAPMTGAPMWQTSSGQQLGAARNENEMNWYWAPNLGLRNPYAQG